MTFNNTELIFIDNFSRVIIKHFDLFHEMYNCFVTFNSIVVLYSSQMQNFLFR